MLKGAKGRVPARPCPVLRGFHKTHYTGPGISGFFQVEVVCWLIMLKPALVLTVACIALWASETRVRMSDLPEAVQQTVKEQTRNATIKGFSKEVEKGKTYFEAETTLHGRSRDILIDSRGVLVEVEEQVALDTLPDAARKTLETRAGSGRIVKVEAVTRGPAVSYEAVILRNGKKSEVAVDANGAITK